MSIPFGSAIIASILAHVAGVFLVITLIDDANAATSDAREIRHEDPPPPPPPEDEITLGIEESQANTMTFIGYDEYEEHHKQ